MTSPAGPSGEDRFGVALGARAESFGLAPEDPLRELTARVLGIHRFCFEQNREVLVRTGSEERCLFLFPDLVLSIEELPGDLARFARDGRLELDVPERGLALDFETTGEVAACTLRMYGYKVGVRRFRFRAAEVLESLRGLLEEILQQAVDGGYVTERDMRELLRPITAPA